MRDVREHFVSIDGARTDYGVVIDPTTGGLELEVTRRLRDESRPPRPRFDRGAATEWLRLHGETLG